MLISSILAFQMAFSALQADVTPVWSSEAIPAWSDADSGAQVVQLTSQAVISTNIYPEQRYTSADGSRIAIERMPFGRPSEVWVVDVGSQRLCRVAVGKPVAANAPLNALYYLDSDSALVRVDLMTLATHVMHRFEADRVPRIITVAPDESCLVGGPFTAGDNVYVLHRVDLSTGQTTTLLEAPDIFNPHLQFDPADATRVLLQINRGGAAGGSRAGVQGATLAILHAGTGAVAPLPVGAPDTPMISGHETWIGYTGRIMFTTIPIDHPTIRPTTGVYAVGVGDDRSVAIDIGRPVNHLAVSDDGQFYIVDEHPDWRIRVGSVATGRSAVLCESRVRQGKPQYTHAHAYMTPDNRHIIFTSNTTGISQVYAAQVPEAFLSELTADRP